LVILAGTNQPQPDSAVKPKAVSLSPEEHFQRVVRAFAGHPNVSVGAGRKKGFGASALSTRAKIFAMLSSRNRFVVKLAKARVEVQVAAGRGTRFDPGHGRLMKEWLEVAPGHEADWLTLAREAQRFVSTGQ